MTQYMISVYHDEGVAMPEGADRQRVFDQVDAFNEKVTEAGIWVFAGGLEPIEATTTVDATGAEPVISDGPTPRPRSGWAGSGSSRPPTWTPP